VNDIQTTGVWKSFGRFDAVRDLTLTVPEGSTFALIGANGAGKTTTIKLLMNIIQPTLGTATVFGTDSRRMSPNQFTRIGYVSEGQEMPGRMSVMKYISYLRPFYPGWDRALETDILAQLRLPAERTIKDLSHGMRLKMALACALPFRPKLLVLDEPFSGLDPLVRDEFMNGMLRHRGEKTVLISSHELAEIEELTTHVAFLDTGALLFQEALSDLKARLRRVRVTMDTEARVPPTIPTDWLDVHTEGSTLTFVDTRFSSDQIAARVAAALGPVRKIDAEPIALRSIFTTLARAVRDRRGG
jgi:ABC-2 type transport system ATP-binding protein